MGTNPLEKALAMEKILKFCRSPLRVFLIYLLTSLVFRFPSLFMDYADIDEVMWGLFANAIVDGQTPYQGVMGEKPPLLYLIYSLVFFLFGKHNYFAVHVLGIFWTALTAYFVHFLVLKPSNLKTAFLAAMASIIFGSALGFRIMATTGELLMNLPLVLSALFFWRAILGGRFGWFFVAGISATLAALFRQQSVMQMGVFAVFILMIYIREKDFRHFFKKVAHPFLGLFLGACLVLAACLAYILATGAWDDFYLWVIKHNYFYIKSGFSNKNVLDNFIKRNMHVLFMTLPLWVLGIARMKSIVSGWRENWSEHSRFELFIFLYFLASLLAVIPGGRFFEHYYLQAIPPLSILAALQLASGKTGWLVQKYSTLFVIFLFVRIPFIPLEMGTHLGDYSVINRTVGNYIRDHSMDSDRIFIWGWNQGIYYYSGREPASRFISADFLTGRSPSQSELIRKDTTDNVTPSSWEMLLDDFALHKPLYILDTAPGNYHHYERYPIDKYPILKQLIDNEYFLEKSIQGINLYRQRGSR